MLSMVNERNIIFQWLSWRFFQMPKKIVGAWKNVLKFYFDYFSTSLLIRTLFSPWRQYAWSYGKGFDLGRYFEVWTSNAISRTIGAILRISLIIIGLGVEFILLLAGIMILSIWLVFPWLLILSLRMGILILL